MIEPQQHNYFWWIFGPVGTAVSGACWWLIQRAWGDLMEGWRAFNAKLDRIETITAVTAENHLATIEKNSIRTNELIEKGSARTNELLEQIHNGQLEMSGFLRGIAGKN